MLYQFLSYNIYQKLRKNLLFIFLTLFACVEVKAEQRADSKDYVRHLCLGFIESKLFEAFKSVAERNGLYPDISDIQNAFAKNSTIVDINIFVATDGAKIYGYKIYQKGSDPDQQPSILVIQGNAILVNQIAEFAAAISAKGYTVYAYDYRGYGLSEGKTSSGALSEDYQSIINDIRSRTNKSLSVYAFSFGGIVALNAFRTVSSIDSAIIDSTPSQLPWYAWCPSTLSPIENVRFAPKHSLFVQGTNDQVVPPNDSAALLAAAARLGYMTKVLDGAGHPFMDGKEWVRRRVEIIEDFISGKL
jgi:alpha/beta superfamily hydrolase